jgi:superoxide oxidase
MRCFVESREPTLSAPSTRRATRNNVSKRLNDLDPRMSVNPMPHAATRSRNNSEHPRSIVERHGRIGGRGASGLNTERQTDRYDGLTRFFHWVFAVVIIYASVVGYALAHTAGGAIHDFLSRLNMSVSTVLILLFPLRLGWKLARVEPRALPVASAWQRSLASGVHNLIYLTIFVVLASGFLMVPNGYSFFGLIEIHTPFGKGALTEHIFAVHRASCALLAGLIVLHVLAVVKHQLIARINVLGRML